MKASPYHTLRSGSSEMDRVTLGPLPVPVYVTENGNYSAHQYYRTSVPMGTTHWIWNFFTCSCLVQVYILPLCFATQWVCYRMDEVFPSICNRYLLLHLDIFQTDIYTKHRMNWHWTSSAIACVYGSNELLTKHTCSCSDAHNEGLVTIKQYTFSWCAVYKLKFQKTCYERLGSPYPFREHMGPQSIYTATDHALLHIPPPPPPLQVSWAAQCAASPP